MKNIWEHRSWHISMVRYPLIVLAILCVLLASTDALAFARALQPAVTVSSGAEIGAFVGSSTPTAAQVKAFEHLEGRHISSVQVYQAWDATSQPSFPASAFSSGVRYHDGYDTKTIVNLTSEPWVSLKKIASGAYDSYLTRYAKQIKAWGQPVRFRFAHEMIQNNVYNNCQGKANCPEWYPWQDQPASYVAAFRHIHDVFRTAGASNVQYVWCPNNTPYDLNVVQQYYPGPDYVDWLCVDGYNPTNKDGAPGYPDWYWFDDLFYPMYHTFTDHIDIFGDKPIMLGELASCEAGRHETADQTKAAWITNTFERLKSTDYSQIKAAYWFNINKECDWRVNSSAPSLKAYKTAIADTYFTSHGGWPFTSAGGNDGWILESAAAGGTGGTINSTATTLMIGDNPSRKQYRAILSFKTDGLPDSAVPTSASLLLKQASFSGNSDPMTSFQGLMVDIRKGFFGSAASLQKADFQSPASKTTGPYLPTLSNGWYSIPLTNTNFAYINKVLTYQSGLTQLRLTFTLHDNGDDIADYLSLYSGNAGAASRPQLIVEYRP